MAFLLAVGAMLDSPFRCCDEIDVYMDPVRACACVCWGTQIGALSSSGAETGAATGCGVSEGQGQLGPRQACKAALCEHCCCMTCIPGELSLLALPRPDTPPSPGPPACSHRPTPRSPQTNRKVSTAALLEYAWLFNSGSQLVMLSPQVRQGGRRGGRGGP